MCVLICPLGHGGYIISNRTVVERREVREVGSDECRQVTEPLPMSLCDTRGASGKGREEGEILLLISQWNTCVVRLFPGPNQVIIRRQLCPDSFLPVSMFCSASRSPTPSLLATLGSSEAMRGHTVSLTEQHTQAVQPAVMKLLQCLPGMSCLTALNMATAFTSLKELLHW